MKLINRKWQLIVILLVVLLPVAGYSQLDPGGDPEANVPVDGGVSILLIAGVAYGVKKYRDAKKKEEEELLK